jgi:hypothetical protein
MTGGGALSLGLGDRPALRRGCRSAGAKGGTRARSKFSSTAGTGGLRWLRALVSEELTSARVELHSAGG